MEGCRSSSGSGFSNFCWMSGNDGGYSRCGSSQECKTAVDEGWGCKIFSCAFNRAPNPYTAVSKTCSYKTAKMVRDLQNDCSAEGASFDSWAKKYRTTGDLYNKFQPCSGRLIEEETKKTIKFCYCFNFCGTEQVYNGCEVEGLEGRLDLGANLFSSYRAICKIDCKPVDKLERISTLRNELSDETITKVVTITEGTTASQGSSHGGSTSNSISASVGLNLKSVFSAQLGYSKTTGYNCAQSSSSSFSRQESHQARIPVKPAEVVSVYQVMGVCDNSDGTVYTVNTKTLVVRGKDGDSTEVVPE